MLQSRNARKSKQHRGGRRYYSVSGLYTCNDTQNRRSRACTDKLHNIFVTNLSVKLGLNMVGEGD